MSRARDAIAALGHAWYRPGFVVPRLALIRRCVATVVLCAAVAGCKRPSPTAPADGAAARATHAPTDAGTDPCAAMSAEQRALVVARVGDAGLTLCDFAQRMNLQNQYLRARFAAPEQRRALLQAWVDSEVLAAEARARGLDREPSVRQAITSQLARELESEIRARVPAPAVTDADVERYYQEHRAEYDTPEQVRLAHIVLATRDRAAGALAEARAHAADDSYFRELARRESQDPATREVGGDVGFVGRSGDGMVPPEVAIAGFALRTPGEIATEPVASAIGGAGRRPAFHVVRLIARRDALHRSLDDVRRAIRSRLARERFDAAQESAVRAELDRLRAAAHVTLDPAALARVHLDVPPGPASDAAAAASR